MSSRQEEKERRRREREEAEAKIKAAEARKKRLGMVAGGVLAVAAVAAAVIAIVVVAGEDDEDSNRQGDVSESTAPIPAPKLTDLGAAARAAKCQLLNPKNEGATHVTDKVTYVANPPTSGNHNPEPAQDGVYVAGNEPATENLVHALEHGRINFQYKRGTPARRISQLETLWKEKDGYHALLYQNNTNMNYAVAATAWDHSIVCPTFNDQVFDAFRAFREQYTDKGPEFVP